MMKAFGCLVTFIVLFLLSMSGVALLGQCSSPQPETNYPIPSDAEVRRDLATCGVSFDSLPRELKQRARRVHQLAKRRGYGDGFVCTNLP